MENITLVVVKPPKTKQNKSVSSEDTLCVNTDVAEPHKCSHTGLQLQIPNNQQKQLPVQNGLCGKLLSAGAAACFADAVTFPLDTAKVRLQIQGEAMIAGAATGNLYRGVLGTLSTIRTAEGIPGWYNGLTAGLQRQLCFASIRIGLYDSMKQAYMNCFNVKKDSRGGDMLAVRIMAGLTTGGLAVLAAQPTDVVKVRMQAQGSRAGAGAVLRYTSNRHAYAAIAQAEGVPGLWKGVLPNMFRNSIVNVSELVSYDLIKEQLVTRRLLRDAMPCHVMSAMCAGFVTTTIASPVDVVKTRIMNSAPGVYTNALSCARDMLRNEGPAAFYKGFTPSFMRIGSWNVLMFVTYEQLKHLVLSRNGTVEDEVFVTHYVAGAAAAAENKNNNSSHRSMSAPAAVIGQIL